MVKILTCAPFRAKLAFGLKTSYGDAFGKLVFFDQKYHTLENIITKTQKLD